MRSIKTGATQADRRLLMRRVFLGLVGAVALVLAFDAQAGRTWTEGRLSDAILALRSIASGFGNPKSAYALREPACMDTRLRPRVTRVVTLLSSSSVRVGGDSLHVSTRKYASEQHQTSLTISLRNRPRRHASRCALLWA